MFKTSVILSLSCILFCSCQTNLSQEFEYLEIRSDIALCGPIQGLAFTGFSLFGNPSSSIFDEPLHSRLLPPGMDFDLPRVDANDNRTAAGEMVNGVLELNLEVVWGGFRMETDDRPGLRLAAIGEVGKSPSVPGPLIRVETGTQIRAQIHNALADSTITVFGLQNRSAELPDSLFLKPGESGKVTFEAGAPGTYLYWMRLGKPVTNFRVFRDPEEQQLAGAFIIDPKGGSPPDRIFVMNIFKTPVDTTVYNYGTRWLEALTINGRSWPFTERLKPAVGDTVRWRIINASIRNHPMHLHGFYYDILSRGTPLKDNIYTLHERRNVVTETMTGRSTMSMEWIPTRPGNWLFHCHLSFHVAPEIRLPGASEADHGSHDVHMAGLVLGIEVPPGPSDLISKGEPLELTLYANEYDPASGYKYGFSLDPDFQPDSVHGSSPRPLILLKQYQTTFITVVNRMTIPTSVHWHGLEIDSWSDGVPGWSASDGRVSPVIHPGEKFTYKLSLMRAGTFIYHSHFDDVHQLTGGLFGPLVVLGEGETYNPEIDHNYITGWKSPNGIELNGRSKILPQHAVVGETHRIRVMNISPAGRISVRMLKEDKPIPLKYLAKDGSDLPWFQQVDLEVSPRYGVGETADFTFTPSKEGTYELLVGYGFNPWKQVWEVASK